MERNRHLGQKNEHSVPLTKEELDEGWHCCPDNGFTLIGPGIEWGVYNCDCDIPALEAEKRSLKHD